MAAKVPYTRGSTKQKDHPQPFLIEKSVDRLVVYIHRNDRIFERCERNLLTQVPNEWIAIALSLS